MQNQREYDTMGEGYEISHYKGSSSYLINEELRGENISKETEFFCEMFDKALDGIPLYKGNLYRYLSFEHSGREAFDEFIAKHVPGKETTYPAYTSASKSETAYKIDGPLSVKIIIEDSTGGYDISQSYGTAAEEEVVFKRNAKFDVISVKNKGNSAEIVLKEKKNGRKGKEAQYDSERVSGDVKKRESQAYRRGGQRLDNGNIGVEPQQSSGGINSEMLSMQALSREREVQGVSERDTEGDNEFYDKPQNGERNSLRPQEALSGGQGDNVRAEGVETEKQRIRRERTEAISLKLMTVIISGFMGYKFGYENIVNDTVEYIGCQTDIMREYLKYVKGEKG